jgi:hypothetical protein
MNMNMNRDWATSRLSSAIPPSADNFWLKGDEHFARFNRIDSPTRDFVGPIEFGGRAWPLWPRRWRHPCRVPGGQSHCPRRPISVPSLVCPPGMCVELTILGVAFLPLLTSFQNSKCDFFYVRSRTLATLIIHQSATRPASPPYLTLVAPMTTSMGDPTEISLGSPPPMVIN